MLVDKIDPLFELSKGKKLVNSNWPIKYNGDYIFMENNIIKFYQSIIDEVVEPMGIFEHEGEWSLYG